MKPSPSDFDQGAGLVLSSIEVKSSSDVTGFTALGAVLRGRRTNLNSLMDGFISFEMSWNAEIEMDIRFLEFFFIYLRLVLIFNDFSLSRKRRQHFGAIICMN